MAVRRGAAMPPSARAVGKPVAGGGAGIACPPGGGGAAGGGGDPAARPRGPVDGEANPGQGARLRPPGGGRPRPPGLARRAGTG